MWRSCRAGGQGPRGPLRRSPPKCRKCCVLVVSRLWATASAPCVVRHSVPQKPKMGAPDPSAARWPSGVASRAGGSGGRGGGGSSRTQKVASTSGSAWSASDSAVLGGCPRSRPAEQHDCPRGVHCRNTSTRSFVSLERRPARRQPARNQTHTPTALNERGFDTRGGRTRTHWGRADRPLSHEGAGRRPLGAAGPGAPCLFCGAKGRSR